MPSGATGDHTGSIPISVIRAAHADLSALVKRLNLTDTELFFAYDTEPVFPALFLQRSFKIINTQMKNCRLTDISNGYCSLSSSLTNG